MIIRVITPIIYQPSIPLNRLGTLGLGNINPTFFFLPAKQYDQRQPDAAAVLHQLQHEKRLVHHGVAQQQRELGGERRKCLHSSVRRRDWAHYAARLSASKHHGAVLWKCEIPAVRLSVEHAVVNCIFVPKDEEVISACQSIR
jgi:hypothetical protein